MVAKVYWDDISSARWELVLALLGLLFLWWDQWVSRGAAIEPKEAPGMADSLVRFVQRVATALGLSRVRGKVRRAILAVLGLVAFLTYFNFGSFHFPNFIHGWDTFHYYIGSKYSRELSYDRLYECVAVADSALPALRRRVAHPAPAAGVRRAALRHGVEQGREAVAAVRAARAAVAAAQEGEG